MSPTQQTQGLGVSSVPGVLQARRPPNTTTLDAFQRRCRQTINNGVARTARCQNNTRQHM
eukprot:6473973-Amphidinium_carterae.2